MLRLVAVGKRYRRGSWVLRGVELDLPPGEVLAVAGANGSGKSTLLRILVGLTRPTVGTVLGRPEVIGYVPDRFAPPERLSATAYLTHLGRVRGLPTDVAAARADELVGRLALAGGGTAPLRTLSKGNAQKVALAQALLVPPQLLVLDEPWSGLDGAARGALAEIIGEVSDAGGAVVFTDHHESLAGRHVSRTCTVGAGGLTSGATGAGGPRAVTVVVVLAAPGDGPGPHDPDWPGVPGVLGVDRQGGTVTVLVARDACDALLGTALRHGWSVLGVSPATGGRTGHGTAGREAVR